MGVYHEIRPSQVGLQRFRAWNRKWTSSPLEHHSESFFPAPRSCCEPSQRQEPDPKFTQHPACEHRRIPQGRICKHNCCRPLEDSCFPSFHTGNILLDDNLTECDGISCGSTDIVKLKRSHTSMAYIAACALFQFSGIEPRRLRRSLGLHEVYLGWLQWSWSLRHELSRCKVLTGVWHRVALGRTDVSEKNVASIIRVKRIGALRTLSVASYC
jgi:hypothetical protein